MKTIVTESRIIQRNQSNKEACFQNAVISRGRRRIRFSERRAPSPKSQRFLAHTLGNSWCLQCAQMYSTGFSSGA